MDFNTDPEQVWLDFNRETIHPHTIPMLKSMCKDEEIQKTLTTLQKGKYIILSKVQLTNLTMRLLQVMMKDEWREPQQTDGASQTLDKSENEHNLEEEEVREITSVTNHSQDTTYSQAIRMDQNDSPMEDAWAADGIYQNKNQNSSNVDQSYPRQGTSRQYENGKPDQPNQENRRDPSKWDKNTPVCKFYKMNTCKFGSKCRQPHPKFCKNFMKNGAQKFNPKGCDNKCGKPHPSTCRNAMKNNECFTTNCRFFHARGTLRGEQKENELNPRQSKMSAFNEQTNPQEQHNYWDKRVKEQELQSIRDQVFMKAQSNMMEMIERLNIQMTAIQKSLPTSQMGLQLPPELSINNQNRIEPDQSRNQPERMTYQCGGWQQNQTHYQTQRPQSYQQQQPQNY